MSIASECAGSGGAETDWISRLREGGSLCEAPGVYPGGERVSRLFMRGDAKALHRWGTLCWFDAAREVACRLSLFACLSLYVGTPGAPEREAQALQDAGDAVTVEADPPALSWSSADFEGETHDSLLGTSPVGARDPSC